MRVETRISEAGRSRIMRGIKARDTRLEVSLRRALRAAGLTGYRKDAPLPGRPDVVFGRYKVAIFVDGCFWHGCPLHYTPPASNPGYWGPKMDRRRLKDAAVAAELSAAGYVVLRFWEHELKADLPGVVRRVDDVLRARGRLGVPS